MNESKFKREKKERCRREKKMIHASADLCGRKMLRECRQVAPCLALSVKLFRRYIVEKEPTLRNYCKKEITNKRSRQLCILRNVSAQDDDQVVASLLSRGILKEKNQKEFFFFEKSIMEMAAAEKTVGGTCVRRYLWERNTNGPHYFETKQKNKNKKLFSGAVLRAPRISHQVAARFGHQEESEHHQHPPACLPAWGTGIKVREAAKEGRQYQLWASTGNIQHQKWTLFFRILSTHIPFVVMKW